jgi:predicted transcriptional regulator YheO
MQNPRSSKKKTVKNIKKKSSSQKNGNSSKPRGRRNPVNRQIPFEQMKKVVEMLGKMFAPFCEVVLHDLTQPERAIVAIENSITGRQIGDATTEIGYRRIREKNFPDILQNYRNILPTGTVLKASSMALRNAEGELLGSLALNLDTTGLRNVMKDLNTFLNEKYDGLPLKEEFTSRSIKRIEDVVMQYCTSRSKTITTLVYEERRELIMKVKEHGLLNLKGGASLLAKILGISRTTIYNNL